MKDRIQSISIKGFKSIRNLRNFHLNPGLNVLIGANGAGKSNFVELFKLIGLLALDGLNDYVAIMGGAETFLFQGAETTEKVEIKAYLATNEHYDYDYIHYITLRRTVKNSFIVDLRSDFNPNGHLLNGRDIPLSPLPNERNDFLKAAINNWQIYHFQNTSILSPFRKDSSVYNVKELLPDGSNLPAFLWALQKNDSRAYEKIRSAVKHIMPVFKDFVLDPIKNESLNDEVVRLCWRQKGSRYLFQPWQMSDGTLRFLALAVALLQPNPPATIIIDEPELGLHPESLNILTGFMHEAAFNSQLIVTTQSPDLLNTMEPEDIVTVNMRNGESVFERLNRADLGEWLEHYAIGELWWKKIIQAGPTYA